MPDDDSLKALARAIARIEAFVEKFPLDAAKDLRARIATIRTLLLEKRPPALALVGRRGAGKSSLVNALFGAKMAELGHVTAQTGRGHWYDYEKDGGAMSILDTRGMQEGSAPAESDDAKTALESIAHELRAKAPDVIVFVVKASDVDSAIDADLDALQDVYDELRRAHRVEPPLIAVITHCDLLEPKSARLPRATRHGRASRSAASEAAAEGEDAIRDLAEKMHHVVTAERTLAGKLDAREKLRIHRVATMGVSAYMSWRDTKERPPAEQAERSEKASAAVLRADDRWRIDDLAVTLFRHLPEAGRAELARATQARGVQDELSMTLTKAAAAIGAAIAATPIPFADALPLTALQAGLVAAIAWIGGRSIDRRGASEFLASLGVNVGAAFVLRQAFRGLLKLVAPGGGPVLSATIAFSGTMAIGSAARAYFIRGVSAEDARKVFRRSSAEKR